VKIPFIVIGVILSLTIAVAQTPEDGRTIFEESDKKLNEIYQKLIFVQQSDSLFIKSLRTAQRQWIQFRDAQFSLQFPDHASIDGTDFLPVNQAMYAARLTDDQAKVLDELLQSFTNDEVYVSDIKIIQVGNVHAGIGIDRPYWGDELKICGKSYKKGLLIHPKDGGSIAFAQFLLPKTGGRLLGIAGWAEIAGALHRGKMRFRIFVDGELLYGNELSGKECQGLNVNLPSGSVLRIETDDGGDGYIADHMAFGDLRIVY